jgi:hypothetical protein
MPYKNFKAKTLRLAAELLLTVSALALTGCKLGSSFSTLKAAPDCGSLTDNSFTGLSYADKIATINQNNALIAAQKQHDELISCWSDPAATIIPGTQDLYGLHNSNSYSLASLSPGKYMIIYKSAAFQPLADHEIWNVEVPSPGDFITARGIGISTSGMQVYQKIQSIDPETSSWIQIGESGALPDNQLAERATETNKLPFYNQSFDPSLAYLKGYIEGSVVNGVGATTDQAIAAGLNKVITVIKNTSGIDTSAWDPNSFGFIDPVTGLAPPGVRFILDADPVNGINLLNIYIRDDRNMLNAIVGKSGWKIVCATAFYNNYTDILNTTQPYADPGMPQSQQALAWDQALQSQLTNTIDLPLYTRGPVAQSSAISSPILTKRSAANSIDVVDQFVFKNNTLLFNRDGSFAIINRAKQLVVP